MTSLTDRYIAAAAARFPDKQREDLAEELRTSIADAVDAKVDTGADARSAEREVLTELGDPVRLAAEYSDRRLHLIGPDLYLTFERLLKTLLVVVVPIIAVIAAIASTLENDSVGAIIGSAVTGALMSALLIAFCVTLVFAVLERSGATESSLDAKWTLDKLPEPRERSISLSDTVASIAFLGLAILAIVLQTWRSFLSGDDGSNIAILDPDLWSFWLPLLIVILAVEILFELAKYRAGRWTLTLAGVNTAINLAFGIAAVYLLASDRLLNPEFVAYIDDNGAAGTHWYAWTVGICVITIVTVTVWTIVAGFFTAWRDARRYKIFNS